MLRPPGPPDACAFCQTLFDRHARVTVQLRHLIVAYHASQKHPGDWGRCADPYCTQTYDALEGRGRTARARTE